MFYPSATCTSVCRLRWIRTRAVCTQPLIRRRVYFVFAGPFQGPLLIRCVAKWCVCVWVEWVTVGAGRDMCRHRKTSFLARPVSPYTNARLRIGLTPESAATTSWITPCQESQRCKEIRHTYTRGSAASAGYINHSDCTAPDTDWWYLASYYDGFVWRYAFPY